VDSLRNKVILVHSYCNDTLINAQGVPGFIAISREIRNFRAHYESVCNQYRDALTDLRIEMDQKFNEMPQEIVNALLEQVRIDGANPITADSIRRIIHDMLVSNGGPLTQIRDSIQQLSQQFGQSPSQRIANVIQAVNHNSSPNLHVWPTNDGRLHRVPYGFKWPSYNTSTLWNLWHFGDVNRHIGPYRNINREHDLTTNICKVNFSRTKAVMKSMIGLAIESNKIRSVGDINLQNNQEVFDHVMPMLMSKLYTDPHDRPIDLNINTLCNRMMRNNRNT